MLTQNEITALNLSPTKKDFVQIWNELLEVAGKLSERWDPTSTNESDPGIVILKAITGIADKLNYNIDKNILEAFMPTAAQEDSMRKLCDMLGYNMKYYRSAETTVTIKYYNSDPSAEEEQAMSGLGQYIPKFTVITNSDKDISYFTTNQKPLYISAVNPILSLVPCMEGQIVKCESNNDNNVITANQVSENNRFYLPETMIAENGIFIYNVSSSLLGELVDGESWTKVDNLNTQVRESRVFKFGYDSYESRPYVEFPEDYSKLFNDGIFIYYARTSGINGNVSTRTLTQIELPTVGNWSAVSTESISVENVFSATSGANNETIKQAYNNFKKTIGTFETLVTCRDYMNKIYSFVESGKPLVSNILVTDIRSDLNKAVTICSCDNAGIFYKETPLFLGKKTISETIDDTGAIIRTVADEYALDHFDLVFYPFKSFNQVKSNIRDIRSAYDASFTYVENENLVLDTITERLRAEDIKTLSHNIRTPDVGDILSINNYLRINATIATNAKVTVDEGTIIIDNIKKALANAFNMRELDFGDEIPFDSIVEVIENADTRIKVASLNEPALYTTFSVLDGRNNNTPVITEYAVASNWLDTTVADTVGRFTKTDADGNIVSTFDTKEAREIYNRLAVRNILAGRVPLFNYNNSFKPSFSEGAYLVTKKLSVKPALLEQPTAENSYTIWTNNGVTYTGIYDLETGNITYAETAPVYKDNIIMEAINEEDSEVVDNYITDISADCKILSDDAGKITDTMLDGSELVKFRAPNFTTIKTYPAYVNYNLDLAGTAAAAEASPARATSLFSILDKDRDSWTPEHSDIRWQKVLDYFSACSTAEVEYKQTFSITQDVSVFSTDDVNNPTIQMGSTSTIIGVGVNNNTPEEKPDPAYLLALSGCAKLTNEYTENGFKARLVWKQEEGKELPAYDINDKLNLVLTDFGNPFVTDVNILVKAKQALDTALSTYRNNLPTECAFTVYFDFECVPFEAKSLAVWEAFIRTCASKFDDATYKYQVLDFQPIDEYNTTILWRLFGDGYDVGKYVTIDTQKLLKFDKSYFGLLQDEQHYLDGIFLVEDLGKDVEPVIIKNNEEYCLRQNEYLYLEYTPSTTTEDGTTEALESVTEVYGPGTIIRPSGFGTGLIDSSLLESTPHKTVKFEGGGTKDVALHRLGSTEQIEIRDFAEVTLSRDTFSDLYVYKNFNGELESPGSVYTLKDGESIFYTDQNKSEFAWFTSGTQVILSGNVKLPEFDIIELSTILDSGMQEIPWKRLTLNQEDTITFQEFQYITLGKDDLLKRLVVLDPEEETASDGTIKHYLSSDWRYCDDVEYILASDPESTVTLPKIDIQGNRRGSGWEVCSTLELDTAASIAQTLRSTDKVEDSITLTRTNTTGGPAGSTVISPQKGDIDTANHAQALSFKTNLMCQACGNQININNVWSNPTNIKGFQLKIFAADEPVIVKTESGKVIPYEEKYKANLAAWSGDSLDAKEYLEIWSQVNLENIKHVKDADSGDEYDNALRLSVSLLPNTYGLFCVYLDYAKGITDAETWIEAVPGTDADDITLLNATSVHTEYLPDSMNKKLSRLYLKPGINCIRVNNTCRFFIKTSDNAQGILFLDELQLVNSLPIKYINADKTVVTLNTQGLNLTQLGYLDTSNSDNSIGTVAKEKLQKAYVEDFYDQLNTIEQDTKVDFVTEYSKVAEILPDVKNLVEIETAVKAELDSLCELDDEVLSARVTAYNTIRNRLKNEDALLTALNSNLEADKLEAELAALLNSLATDELSREQILDKLSLLKNNAISTVEALSDDDILADYLELLKLYNKDNNTNTDGAANAGDATAAAEGDANADGDAVSDGDTNADDAVSDDDANANSFKLEFNNIRNTALSNLEKEYYEKLITIISSIEQTVTSETRANLVSILEELRASETTDTNAQLVTLVSKLNDILEQDIINSILIDMVNAASQPDFNRLYSDIIELDSLIELRDLPVVVAELEQAASSSNNAQLASLVAELATLIANINKDDDNTLRKAITDLANKVRDKVATPSETPVVDQEILTDVEAIRTTFITDYKDKLTDIATALANCVTVLQEPTNISELLAVLQTSEDTQIEDIKNEVDSITASYTNMRDEITRINWNDWQGSNCDVIIRKAIVTVWPSNVALRTNISLSVIEQIFTDALDSTLASIDTHLMSLNKLFNGKETDIVTSILIKVIHIEDFIELFSDIEKLLGAEEQKKINEQLIATICKLVPASSDIANATSSDNVVIQKILTELKNDEITVAKKKQLEAQLKVELEKAINLDEQLLSIIANILFEDITKNIAELKDAGEFYALLLNELQALSEAILDPNCKIAELAIAVDTKYLELFELSQTDFESALVNAKLPSETLLPDSVIALVSTMSNILSAQSAQQVDITVLYEKALESLTSTELRELLDTLSSDITKEYLEILCDKVNSLEQLVLVDTDYEEAFKTLKLEEQLLADIRAIDINRDFYYNAPITTSLAIELNESTASLNTLMNPQVNYDINNVNNGFVISKLDIDFLDSGIQIARSSRLN